MAKVIRGKGGNQREEYLYKINMYHEKMFDEKFARASSPDALFNIGVEMYVNSVAIHLSEFVFHT